MKTSGRVLMVLPVLILVLLSVLCGCQASVNDRSAAVDGIVSGTPVGAGDSIALTTVSVFSINSAQNMIQSACSGSIIAKDLVITAAHCFKDVSDSSGANIPANQVVIYLGNYIPPQQLDPKHLLRIADYKIQSGYTGIIKQGVKRNDLALIKVQGSFPSPYHAAAIAPASLTLMAGAPVVVAGYGLMSGTASVEKSFQLNRYDLYHIMMVYPGTALVDLLGTPGTGVFGGDSGGPAMIKDSGRLKLWGVLSAAGLPQGLAEYTDLRDAKAWIASAARALGSSFDLE